MRPGSIAPWPYFTDEEVAAVSRVLLSNGINYWTGHAGRAASDRSTGAADRGPAVGHARRADP